MSRTLINSTWWVKGHKTFQKTDDPIQTQSIQRRAPWLVDSPVVAYESYEECAGNCDPKTETPIEVLISIVGTRKKITVD